MVLNGSLDLIRSFNWKCKTIVHWLLKLWFLEELTEKIVSLFFHNPINNQEFLENQVFTKNIFYNFIASWHENYPLGDSDTLTPFSILKSVTREALTRTNSNGIQSIGEYKKLDNNLNDICTM